MVIDELVYPYKLEWILHGSGSPPVGQVCFQGLLQDHFGVLFPIFKHGPLLVEFSLLLPVSRHFDSVAGQLIYSDTGQERMALTIYVQGDGCFFRGHIVSKSPQIG